MNLKCRIATFYCGTSIPCGGSIRWVPTGSPTAYAPQSGSPPATALTYSGSSEEWSFQVLHGPAGGWTTYVKPGEVEDPTGVYARTVTDCTDAPMSVTVMEDQD
jgi:hypothetical protein